ncbi:MAG: hypothetical protein IPJ04_03855 [Candidatus Eisenbacteria bacterium]|nr:hypothetical protein [Candidatus Eisenbacteria bacterium]
MKPHSPLWAMLGAAALLAAQPNSAHGASDARSWRPATNTALEFGIVRAALTDFDGATISLRRQHGEHAVWRLGFELGATRQRIDVVESTPGPINTPALTHTDDFSINAQLTRLTFPWPERRLRPWAGLALGGGSRREAREEHLPGIDISSSEHGPRVYLATLAGVEYSLSTRIAVHAQYGQGVQYTRRRDAGHVMYYNEQASNGSSSDWQLYSTGARFGLAVFY